MGLITRSSVLVAVFIGIGVGSARAQERVVAKIPFPFAVIGQQFPALHLQHG
jgi:ABC-type proline/glycine betaine transport system permease subunit